MSSKSGFFCTVVLAALAALVFTSSVSAQVELGINARPRITQWIDETNRVAVAGNTHPEARPANDRGAVASDFAMEHMLLQLQRSPEQEVAVQQFLDELTTQGSPNFHKWLTAQEFGERFGLAKPDLDAVTGWLKSHGFRVNVVYPSGMLIDFSGTAGHVRKAFQTEIHRLEVKGERHVGNMSDPRIPAALEPVIAGVVSLHDFRPHAMYHMRRAKTEFTFTDILGSVNYAVVPADLATIYNLNPVFSAGNSGQGETIVLIEDTDVFSAADWSTFRQTFGLAGYTSASFTQVHPPAPAAQPANNCGAPGVVAGSEPEAILDAEWASAAAPSAAIEMAACADTSTTFGGLIAIQNLINASTPPPSIMSISYGQCETVDGAAANAAYNSAYQQAVAEGVSVFVAAGDSGAAGCDNSVAEATHGIGVNAFASTPNNVAVGGTDFSDTYFGTNATYWNSSNTSAFGSAISYVPETPWNDSCASFLFSTYVGYSPTYGSTSLCNDPSIGFALMTTVAGGGGPSQCATGAASTAGVVSGTCAGWPKPSWQTVLGNPQDGVRDTPDVSLFAADGLLWSHYYIFCWSDTAKGGAACGSDPSTWMGAGGTSFASPIMAGIQALINQKAGGPQGNPAPVYYQLAAAEYGASGSTSCNSSNGNAVASNCVFYDVTFGDMDVDCVGPNCFLAGAPVGVLSTSDTSFAPAYGTTVGWDFATGIGSVNAANLINNWPASSKPPVLGITKTHTGSFSQGQQNATYSVTVSNAANAGSSSGTVTVTESVPSGLTLVSMAGTGWTCSANRCSRGDALNRGASFPAITVTVNVASNASSPQVNQVGVSGGGSGNANASDSTTIVVVIPSAAATFVAADTSTQGNWRGVYGADGYSVANDSQSIPGYASLAVQDQLNYTWASTTDARALQTGSGTGRIAATWYGNSTFSFDVNLSDGNVHQFALYAVDWDLRGRTETIQILDANSNAVLDARTLSGFSNGVYLVWNLSGHVKINVIWTGGANAVVSGVFFGGTSSVGETVSVSPQNINLLASQQQQFTAIVNGSANQAVSWSIASVSPSSAAAGSISVAGLYTAPATITPAQVTIKATSADGTASGISKVNLIIPAAASFVAADTSTQGNWRGVYGADGYSVANDSQSIPGYASLAVQNQLNYTWAASTADARALQTGSGTGRIAATWYGNSTFSFDVNLSDGNVHQFALYAVDWDLRGRTETIQVVDANSSAVLDTRTLSGFSNGVYLVWNLSGHVKINVIWTGGANAVVSGVFFK